MCCICFFSPQLPLTWPEANPHFDSRLLTSTRLRSIRATVHTASSRAWKMMRPSFICVLCWALARLRGSGRGGGGRVSADISRMFQKKLLSAVPLLTTCSSVPGPHVPFALQKYTPLSSTPTPEMKSLVPGDGISVFLPVFTSTAWFRSSSYLFSLYHCTTVPAEAEQFIFTFCLVLAPMNRGIWLICRAPVQEHLKLRSLHISQPMQDFAFSLHITCGLHYTIHEVKDLDHLAIFYHW